MFRAKRKTRCVIRLYFSFREYTHSYPHRRGFPGANLKQKFTRTVTDKPNKRQYLLSCVWGRVESDWYGFYGKIF